MNNDIQYFAKKKDSSEPPEPILTDWAVSPVTHVKGLLQCIPSTYECSLEIQRSKEFKDLIAMLLGYARPSSIKRTRKRQLRRAKYTLTTQAMNGRSGGTSLLESQRGENNEIT